MVLLNNNTLKSKLNYLWKGLYKIIEVLDDKNIKVQSRQRGKKSSWK